MTTDADKPAFPLLPYQTAAIESNARFRWSCWSRQTGKSFTMSLRRILRGLQRRRNQIFLSASERQSKELMQKARQHCQALKIATDYYDSRFFENTSFKQLEIELPRGVRIIGLPANPDTIRGFTGDVFLDEFAMHADDRAVWAAIFPSLLRNEGELDVASTPKGMSNMFHRLAANDRFERTTLTLPDAIKQGLNVNAEDIRSSMCDDQLYRQEFLCEFLDETTALLTYQQIAACQDPALEKDATIDQLATLTGDLYVGIDIGRKRDFTVLWILERNSAPNPSPERQRAGFTRAIFTTRAVYEHQSMTFRDQQELIAEVLSLHNVRRACIDAGGLGMQLAESAVEDFGLHRVEPVVFTNAIKSDLAGRLRIAVEDAAIRIPVDSAIRDDWHSVQRSISSAGQMRFDADRSAAGHADRFWAAALALRAAAAHSGEQRCLNVKPLSFANNGAW